MGKIARSELIINPEGRIYHLHLKPAQIADTILIVGNPRRVPKISRHFDKIEHKVKKREFITHTGLLKGKRLSVLSTGIGPDNIDIVLNELDALANIDFETRQIKPEFKKLTFVRLGTSGSLQKEIPVDSFVASKYGMGLDNLMTYYDYSPSTKEKELEHAVQEHLGKTYANLHPYFIQSDTKLFQLLSEDCHAGITATAPGFYAPQGRQLRAPLAFPKLNKKLQSFQYQNDRITNFEMETSALFGLSRLLGHSACTVCAIIANRSVKQFSKDPGETVEKLIKYVLDKITG